MIYLDVVNAPDTEIFKGKKASSKTESSVRTGKILELDPSHIFKTKTSERTYCPYCNRESVLIWVHGHYQCSRCKYVVVSCCEAN